MSCFLTAVAALAGNADIILHAGDFVSAKAYASLAELGRLEAVHGNSDSARAEAAPSGKER